MDIPPAQQWLILEAGCSFSFCNLSRFNFLPYQKCARLLVAFLFS
jgi:hypothetical protein